MNDSAAAAEFLRELNVPFRSAVSLDIQTIEAWQASGSGLNPIQAGMQIAIPEIDGATEPFVYGGMPAASFEPVPLDDRCQRFARRLKNWNRVQTAERADLKLALVIYCFPPNKGNIGTAADLDVFASVLETLRRLKDEGYAVVGAPNGLDITPNDSAIYIADGTTIGTQGFFKKVNLATGAVSSIAYTRAAFENGAFDVAISSNGLAFGTTSGNSTSVPFHQIDTDTEHAHPL